MTHRSLRFLTAEEYAKVENRRYYPGLSVMPGHVARLGIGTTIAAMCLVAVSAQRLADPPTSVALYAGVGEELITFGVDVEHATLSRQSS
jgi:hypothetical protein